MGGRPSDHGGVSDVSGTAVPASDVLPSAVRRRLGARDAALAGILAGELLTGVVLGAAWQAREDLGRILVPAPSVMATSDAPGVPVSGVTTTMISVPPPPTPPPPPPPPLREVPRNPFEVQTG
jgi:hypothetical protein